MRRLDCFNFLPRFAALAVTFAWLATCSFACQIPVFRYALERWEPDAYRLTIVHRGPLTSEQQEWAGILQDAPQNLDHPVNIEINSVDLEQADESSVDELWGSLVTGDNADRAELPLIALQYPRSVGARELAWTGPLTAENAAAVVDSPARQQIARRLLDGQSAVWVLLETGDAEQDRAALAVMESELPQVQGGLELPAKEELEQDEFFRPDTKVDLRLEFSIVTIAHDDPREAVLRSILRHSEPGLFELNAPIAIPVYGRGRTYYALVGKGISHENIDDNCRFVAGACSCQVKAQNPGVDLPFAVAWSREVTGSAMPAVILPELTGLGSLEFAEEPPSVAPQPPIAAPAGPASTGESPPHDAQQLAATETTAETADGRGVAPVQGETVSSGGRASTDSGSLTHRLFYALMGVVGGMVAVIAVASMLIRQRVPQ